MKYRERDKVPLSFFLLGVPRNESHKSDVYITNVLKIVNK
jgi:hypothetical protein